MSMQQFFEWFGAWPASIVIRESTWIYAFVQAFHLVALAVFFGSVLIVDLRLLGRGMRERPLAQVARDAWPWFTGSLLALLVTGIPQMMSNASREYYSPYFWFKMEVMLVALVFTFTLRRRITLADETRVGPVWGKVVGLASIVLWLSVAIPARLIGLL